jgi:hypothetical protein
MRYSLLLAVLLLGFSSLSSSVAVNPPQEKFLQGTWHLEGSDGKTSWTVKWTFDMGSFTLEGYPQLHQEGSYQITNVDGNKVSLELYDQKGNFGTEKSQIEVVLDKKKDTLMIKGQGPFTRVKE